MQTRDRHGRFAGSTGGERWQDRLRDALPERRSGAAAGGSLTAAAGPTLPQRRARVDFQAGNQAGRKRLREEQHAEYDAEFRRLAGTPKHAGGFGKGDQVYLPGGDCAGTTTWVEEVLPDGRLRLAPHYGGGGSEAEGGACRHTVSPGRIQHA